MLGITCDGEASHYYIQTYNHVNKRMILISYQSVIDSINKINNELLQWVINGIHEYLVTSMSNCRPQNLFAIIDRLQNFLSSIDNSLIIDGAYWLISWLLTNYPSTTHWFITVYYIYGYIQTGFAFLFKFKPLFLETFRDCDYWRASHHYLWKFQETVVQIYWYLLVVL